MLASQFSEVGDALHAWSSAIAWAPLRNEKGPGASTSIPPRDDKARDLFGREIRRLGRPPAPRFLDGSLQEILRSDDTYDLHPGSCREPYAAERVNVVREGD
jgi:hypothetical protein